jgi:hypothetical protein
LLGLPGLVFLLWGWLANSHSGYVGWLGDDHSHSVHHFLGCVEFRRAVDLGMGFEFGDQGFRSEHFLKRPDELWPPAFRFEQEVEPGTQRATTVRIADWAIVLAYLLLWTAVQWRWQRRKARLSRRAAVELPGT